MDFEKKGGGKGKEKQVPLPNQNARSASVSVMRFFTTGVVEARELPVCG
jgi:hypothetical protein